MPLALTSLDSCSRMLVEAELRVAPGTGGRFQPTGFPDLGPALYKGIGTDEGSDRAVVIDMLLVESVQSMANRLEDVCLQGEDYNADCQGIPYVRVLDGHRGNAFLTSSVREPHRLASDYVLDAKLASGVYLNDLKNALQASKHRPVHIWRMVPAIFDRDPGCVLHGVFLERIDGRIRLPRLLSAYIEARSPNQANSGGVHRGEVTAKDNIPYPRQEFTSPSITASFIFHASTLKGYGLDENRRRFLQAWAIYKIDRFLHEYLRLRTACEFEVGSIKVTLDGKAGNLGEGDGKWPKSDDIKMSLTNARDTCFPKPDEGTATMAAEDAEKVKWQQRRVTVVTYALDIVGEEELPEGLTADKIALTGYEGRAAVTTATKGKGQSKKTVTVLRLTGEWPEEDQEAFLLLNPEKLETDDQQTDNPAHAVVKAALKKWNEAWRKLQKKIAGSDEGEGQV